MVLVLCASHAHIKESLSAVSLGKPITFGGFAVRQAHVEKENLMQVTIDGVPFVPACASASRIGIAITTHNRSDVLNRAIEQHIKHLPAGALVVVIDDGSKPAAVVPDGVQLLRHETSLGIVASKNASLTLLT